MGTSNLFYCWVKLSKRVPKADPASSSAHPELEDARQRMAAEGIDPPTMVSLAMTAFGRTPNTFSGGIPPGTAHSAFSEEILSGGIPPGTPQGGVSEKLLSGGIPPGFRIGGLGNLFSWIVDMEFSGKPESNLVVDYAPVAGTKDDALEWLETHATWLDATVETYFLMVFASTPL